jgi:hypothetical protein
MSEDTGSARKKLRSHMMVEVILVAVLALYLLLARGQMVGDDVAFTMAGAGLMALVTYWTLHTLRDGLEVIALRGRLKH